MTALRLREVSAGYGDGKPVLETVSVDLVSGGWLAIVGPNGAGKSTLLKAVTGVIPHTGVIELHDTRTDRLSRKEKAQELGYSPQSPALPEGLTVTDYALLGRTPHLHLLARESDADLALVQRILGRLELEDLAERKLRTLSGGERQRAVLARVLAQRTRFLLLDEPTTGLDMGHAQAFLERLDRLRREDGTTVVSTLHDLTFAAQYADQLLLLDEGTVVAAGSPTQVLSADRLQTHYRADTELLVTGAGDPVIAPRRAPRK